MTLPAASIIVAVYNAEHTVKDCLDSLLALDYPEARREVIVVDNGSCDATPEILDTFAHAITVAHEGRRGPAAARNTGVLKGSGDVVAFTDADCVVDTHWLRRIVVPLEDPTVGVVGGRILARRPCGRIAAYGERVHDHGRAIERLRPPYAITMNWASRRAVVDAAGGFNTDLLRCSDVDLAYRLTQAGYRLLYEPSAVVYHSNRSTVPALMRQGYHHGYHAVQVRRLHAAFLSRHGHRTRSRHVRFVLGFAARLGRSGVRNVPWAFLFELAKSVGHVHGTVAAAAQSRERRAAV